MKYYEIFLDFPDFFESSPRKKKMVGAPQVQRPARPGRNRRRARVPSGSSRRTCRPDGSGARLKAEALLPEAFAMALHRLKTSWSDPQIVEKIALSSTRQTFSNQVKLFLNSFRKLILSESDSPEKCIHNTEKWFVGSDARGGGRRLGEPQARRQGGGGARRAAVAARHRVRHHVIPIASYKELDGPGFGPSHFSTTFRKCSLQVSELEIIVHVVMSTSLFSCFSISPFFLSFLFPEDKTLPV